MTYIVRTLRKAFIGMYLPKTFPLPYCIDKQNTKKLYLWRVMNKRMTIIVLKWNNLQYQFNYQQWINNMYTLHVHVCKNDYCSHTRPPKFVESYNIDSHNNNTHLMNVMYIIISNYKFILQYVITIVIWNRYFPGYVSNYIHRKPLTINNLVLYVILYYYFVYLDIIKHIWANTSH